MNLSDYIRQVGGEQFAKQFSISKHTARAYLYGERIPRTGLAKRIVEATPVTWAGISGNEPVERPAQSGDSAA